MLANAAAIWNHRERWGTLLLVVFAMVAGLIVSRSNLPLAQIASQPKPRGRIMGFSGGAGGGAREKLESRNSAPKMMAISEGVVGGLPGGNGEGRAPSVAEGRKIVRTVYLDLVVSSPAETLASVRAIAEKLGGYIASSEVSGSAGQQQGASAVIWVPATQFDAARTELRNIAKHVDTERTSSSDMTTQYVDTEAALRNYRAEEAQYLEIMKRAVSVKDTLAVSEKLADVRQRIDSTESEFRALSHQVDMTSITVNLLSEPVASSGLDWRPAYRVKEAARLGLEAIADFVSSATDFAFQIPAILLWAASFFIGLKVAWYVLRRSFKSLKWMPKASTS